MATIAELEAQRARLLAQRERIVSQAGGYANITEGSSALTQIQQINEELAAVVTEIENLMQKQPASTATVSSPLPPVDDPFANSSIANGTGTGTTNGTGTARVDGFGNPIALTLPAGADFNTQPKAANNQANDDNPQTSDVTLLGGNDATAVTPTVTTTATVDETITPQPNVLDAFASYTYQAAVYLMTPDQLNTFQRSRKKSVNGYNLLFQSGGAPNNIGGAQGAGTGKQYSVVTKDGADIVTNSGEAVPGVTGPDAGRNPYFPNDFYIDSITIENVPLGKGTMSAHGATQLKFTVIEPANITLLDCMYQAVQDMQPKSGGGAINYAAACYLMVIRFYGYDANGVLQRVAPTAATSNQSDPTAVIEKYIPFKIKDIQWEVNSRLVNYQFDCAPIGQIVAQGTRRGTIPADFEISGQTVGELLVGSVATNNATATGNVTDQNQSAAETARLNAQNPAPPKATAAQQKGVTRAGLVGAMNAEQQRLVKTGEISIADEYEIVFAAGAEKIKDATLIMPGNTVNKGATDMGPAPQQNPSGLSPDKGAVNSNSRNQGITAGMQMVQAIELAIRNSNYIKDQATTVVAEGTDNKSEANGAANQTTFSWFNIAFSAEQLGYDEKRNDFAYRVRYTIIPYTPTDFQSQYFPRPKFRGVVKSYPYWFTGENTAVLDYRANFNKLYTITVSGSSVENSLLARNRQAYVQSMRDLPFIQTQARSTESGQGAQGRANDIAANAAEYLYNPADNGEGEITIVGDPAWIQQGSVLGHLDPKKIDYRAFAADGTINFDSLDVLFEIAWQRPEDYDLNTGLADPYSRTKNSFGNRLPRQSVVYRMKSVTSEFRQGRFQQKVKGVLYMYPVKGQQISAEDSNQSAAETARLAAQNQTAGNNLTNQSAAETARLAAQNQSIAAGLRSAYAGIDPRRIDKPAAALATSAGAGPRLAPMSTTTETQTGSGEFSATSPTPADTITPLPPAQPVSSNGEVVDQSAAETARLRRYTEAVVGALNLPQQGARDF